MKEYSGAQATADADANRAASVMLDVADLPSDFSGALDRLLEALRASLPAKFAPVLQPDQLVAAQPNVHGGLRFLPPHLDEPLHDGFGVVIVTVAVAGGGRILLQSRPFDAARRRDYNFQMAEGGAYVLSGDARNTCLHGVIADAGARESLNLRFGLHTAERGAPFSAWEIEQHGQRRRRPTRHRRSGGKGGGGGGGDRRAARACSSRSRRRQRRRRRTRRRPPPRRCSARCRHVLR